MRLREKVSSVIFIFSFLTISISAQDLYRLAYKPVKGNAYFYITRTDLNYYSEANDKETELDQKLVFKLRLDIKNVTSNQFNIKTTIDSCHIKSTNPYGGKDIINNGEGVTGTVYNMSYSIYGSNIDRKSEKNKNIMERTSSMSDAMIMEFPERLVTKGEKWTIIDTMYFPFGRNFKIPIILITETRLAGTETIDGKECLKLKFSRELDLDETTELDGKKVDLVFTLETEGICYFDYKLGMIRLVEETDKLNFKANSREENMKVVLKLSSSSKINLINK